MSKWSRDEKKAFTVLAGWSLGLILLIASVNTLLIFNSFRMVESRKETRQVASLQAKVPLKGTKAPVMHWDCQKSKQQTRMTTQSLSARVQIQNCPKIKVLKNKSNQGLAHLFPLESGSWTSDFIQLKEGSNSLLIDWGERQQVLEITREMPASLTANKEL